MKYKYKLLSILWNLKIFLIFYKIYLLLQKKILKIYLQVFILLDQFSKI